MFEAFFLLCSFLLEINTLGFLLLISIEKKKRKNPNVFYF